MAAEGYKITTSTTYFPPDKPTEWSFSIYRGGDCVHKRDGFASSEAAAAAARKWVDENAPN